MAARSNLFVSAFDTSSWCILATKGDVHKYITIDGQLQLSGLSLRTIFRPHLKLYISCANAIAHRGSYWVRHQWDTIQIVV